MSEKKESTGNYYRPVIWHQMGTKGQSKLRRKTHTMPGIGRPLAMPRTTYYSDTSRDYSIDDSLNRVEYFSNAVMEDQYDAAIRSRGRDDALLRNANATIEQALQPSEEKGHREGVWAPTMAHSRSIIAPSLRSLSMYSDLVSLTTDRPTPSLQLEGIYYRPVVSTSGLHASHPPMMNPTDHSLYRDSLGLAGQSSEVKNEGINEHGQHAQHGHGQASSAEDAKIKGGSVNIPAYYACGGDPLNRPVTELRRKMRRMVASGKRNPNYYRMGLDD